MVDRRPLASWNDSAPKSAILDFIARVTNEGGAEFAPPAERIAVFDNDGTLCCEQPLQIQYYFAFNRVKELSAKDPTMAERQPFMAVLEHDYNTLSGSACRRFMNWRSRPTLGSRMRSSTRLRANGSRQRNPKVGRLFKECVYQPQVKLLAYLRENGFKTYIVSAGGADFMRAFVEDAYGVPREQVIGSSVKLRFDADGDRVSLSKLSELNIFNDREAKPLSIGLHIGRRPLLAFGNSDGDLAMMRYARSGSGPRLALLLRHDARQGSRLRHHRREHEAGLEGRLLIKVGVANIRFSPICARRNPVCPLYVCAVQRRRFPVGASPTRQPLQPEATGAVMEVTKWLKPSV
jgi:haloacid dehalogenase-like hydrolase